MAQCDSLGQEALREAHDAWRREPFRGSINGQSSVAGGSEACGAGRALYDAVVDLGEPISYEVLSRGTAVYSAHGKRIGKVTHVLAVEDEDVFDADDVEAIYEKGVVLKLSRGECEQLPKPSASPAVMRDDPAESSTEARREKLMRAWGLISGDYRT